MLTTNQIIHQGRYRIVNQLGQNGIGVGYEAFDTVNETNVLLKELRDSLGKVTTPAQLEANKMTFTKKAKTLSEMRHDSLLHVQDFFSEVDRHYLVTEFIDGNTLGELLEKKNSPFPLADVGNWADRLLDALNYLHTQNPQIIHREIKPSNIRLSSSGKAKLLVFNIIKNADEKSGTVNANQTFDAAALPYLPLEQIWDGLDAASQKVILTNYDEKSEKILEQPLDTRSDLYALAATLYQLLTARLPADPLTRSIDILEGKSDPLQRPNQINPSVPPEISDVLMKALEIKRENRFSSAIIMRQVLRTAFVRAKERESKDVQPVKHEEFSPAKPEAVKPVKQEDDAVLEIPVIEQKPVAPTTPPVAAPKNLEIETEQARQLEFIKQQLREAEERRLEAEKRATEAEKRLIEAEKHITIEPAPVKEEEVEIVQKFTPAPVAEVIPEPEVQVIPEPKAQVIPEPKAEISAPEYSSDEFSSLFAEQPKESNVLKKVAAAAVVLIVLSGGGFGIWTFMKNKSAAPMSTMSSTNAVIPAPTTEATPAPTVETTAPAESYQAVSETNTPQLTTPPSTETKPETSSNPAVVKTKATTTPTPVPAKKPAATPAKPTETQKKVTLDDLLKDN